MARKTFVLRSNALLSSAHSTLKFGNDNVIAIPMAVLDEINQRRDLTVEKQKIRKEIMSYIRSFNRDELFSVGGVTQKNGSVLRMVDGYVDENIPYAENLTVSEIRTLQICKALSRNKNCNVILVTNDPCLQLRAEGLGIKAENFRDETFPNIDEQYTGRITIEVPRVVLDEFYRCKRISIDAIVNCVNGCEFVQNQFVILHESCVTGGKTGTARGYGKVCGNEINLVRFHEKRPYGVRPMNDGQRLMFNAIYGEQPLVVIKGAAGTGKNYVTLAISLELLESEGYERILVTRKTDYSELGFLPGDVDQKMAPYLAAFKDNLSMLINSDSETKGSNSKSNKKGESSRDYRRRSNDDGMYEDGSYYFETGKIKIQAINMLRGRSICNTIFIIDEAQNIEPEFIKTIVTRAGEGSKFIFLGDPTQIDNPALNERYNGLVYLSEKMKGSRNTVQVSLFDSESVRSELAREATEIL